MIKLWKSKEMKYFSCIKSAGSCKKREIKREPIHIISVVFGKSQDFAGFGYFFLVLLTTVVQI